jgi:hypothetical protein
MRKLLLCAALMMPLGCSGKLPAPTTPKSIEKCDVLRLVPPPPIAAADCGNLVCFPVDDVVALALWIADVEETRIGLEGCPYVAPVDK